MKLVPINSLRLDKGSHLPGEELGLFCAIVECDPTVGVAAKEESRMCGSRCLDGCHAVKMSKVVLRNAPLPAHDVMKDGRGCNAHREAQFGLNGTEEAAVIPAHDFRPVPAAAHDAQEHMARRGTI